jgi:hypothetical protein
MNRTIDIVMRKWAPLVAEAALAFERRWTRRALEFYNPKLHDQFETQIARFDTAMNSGTSTEIETEGARLCRAYGVVAAELARANVVDDAYAAVMLGEKRRFRLLARTFWRLREMACPPHDIDAVSA